MKLRVEIDPHSGFCYGVVKAIEKAEEFLASGKSLVSLGEIVHNSAEVDRLSYKGLTPVNYDSFVKGDNEAILFRAHGEPPSSYQIAKEKKLRVIDATCPVVLKLQERIRKAFSDIKSNNGQLVIFGKKGHPEVIGLIGQVDGQAIIVETQKDIEHLDFSRPIELFAQTTKDVLEFKKIVETIKERIENANSFKYHDTICRQVSNRLPWISKFATEYDVVIFVGGANSSNAKVLFKACKHTNKKSYFISTVDEFDANWLIDSKSVGICGATSTPRWQLDQVLNAIKAL